MNLTAKLPPTNWIGSIVASCALACSVGVLGNEEQPTQTEDASVEPFTFLDSVETRNAFREERHEQAVEALATTSLSQEHQELLANAVGKMYLGIPVSSYTATERGESSDEDEPTESKNTWSIRETGQFHNANESTVQGLRAGAQNSPFHDLLGAEMLRDESLKVLNESDSEITFVLDMDMSIAEEGSEQEESHDETQAEPENESEDVGLSDLEEFRQMGDMFGKGNFVSEITVDKLDESVASLVLMKLQKPLRRRFLFKITTLEMVFHFSYVESCDGYAVERQTFDMEGSALGAGKFFAASTLTFTDVACEKPVRYLLPD